MTYSGPVVEVNIVNETAVRQYARNRLHPDAHEAIEDTILDDERARALVAAEAAPADKSWISKRAKIILQTCLLMCEGSIRKYVYLSGCEEQTTIHRFAVSRLAARRDLFIKINDLVRNLPAAADDDAVSYRDETDSPDSCQKVMDAAIANDRALALRLRLAFRAPAAPYWKATLAGWLAALVDDIDRVEWLKRRSAKA